MIALPLRKLNAALYKSCRKAGFSAAFLRFFFKAVEKARFYFRPAFFSVSCRKAVLFLSELR